MRKMKTRLTCDSEQLRHPRIHKFYKDLKRDWRLWVILLLPMLYVLIFYYGPMYGLQIAFRDYRPVHGIVGSKWVGLQWFEKFITNYQFGAIFKNTIILSLYSLVVGFPLPIIFALALNAVQSGKFKKFTQTVSYIPHFISLAVAVSIVNMILSPVNGIYGNVYHLFGGEGYLQDFRSTAEAFRHIYVWSGVWQELGWNSIIYMAALSSVSHELHEAAMLDGASRWKRIWHIDFPTILPTVCIMFIMRCGSIISVGFEKVYLMQTSMNLNTAEVISTYVYKVGMSSFRNFSYGAAVGLFNTAINLVLLILVNTIVKKLSESEISLF